MNEPHPLTHAWAWFEFHASQRLTMIRFYIVAAGAVAAGIGYGFQSGMYFLVAPLSLFGAIATFCFLRLDRRVADLVKIGEAALKAIQAKLALSEQCDAINICKIADEKRGYFPYTYRQNFQVLFWSAFFLFIFALLASIRMLLADLSF